MSEVKPRLRLAHAKYVSGVGGLGSCTGCFMWQDLKCQFQGNYMCALNKIWINVAKEEHGSVDNGGTV
jgi:hypothetical protein